MNWSHGSGRDCTGVEHPLSAGFLNDGDQYRGARKKAKHDGLFEIAENEVDRRRAQQQREHRLVQDLEEGAAVGLGGYWDPPPQGGRRLPSR
jgi:hypothetical protein